MVATAGLTETGKKKLQNVFEPNYALSIVPSSLYICKLPSGQLIAEFKDDAYKYDGKPHQLKAGLYLTLLCQLLSNRFYICLRLFPL